MSEVQYVVVIEIDNKRAAAAYAKALSDLDSIWEQIMKWAKEKDQPYIDRQQTMSKVKEAEYDKKLTAYNKNMEEILQWESSWTLFRGPRPERIGIPFPDFYTDHFISQVDQWKNLREGIERRWRVADLAISPFRVEENVAIRISSYEDGTFFKEIKDKIFKNTALLSY